MTKIRGILLLAAAAAISYFAADRVSQYLEDSAPEQMPVLVAADDIETSEALTRNKVTFAEFEPDKIPGDVLFNPDQITGRTAAAPILKGEPIRASKLILTPGPEPDIGVSHPEPGMRIVRIELDPADAVTGILRAGDRVDVISVTPLEGGSREWISHTLLSDIEVLETGLEDEDNTPRFSLNMRKVGVSLIVSPEQSLVLGSAGNTRLKLVKRSPEDTGRNMDNPTFFSASLGPKTLEQIKEMTRQRDTRLQQAIQKGMRAVTIRVSDEDGILGELRPGNRIDVVATSSFIQAMIHGRREAGTKATVQSSFKASKILMQNIEVLFIEADVALSGPKESHDPNSPVAHGPGEPGREENGAVREAAPPTKRVTVLVTPKDAEKLIVIATTYAAVKLILRQPGDATLVSTPGQKSTEIFSDDKSRYHDIQVYSRGTERLMKRFDKKTYESVDMPPESGSFDTDNDI